MNNTKILKDTIGKTLEKQGFGYIRKEKGGSVWRVKRRLIQLLVLLVLIIISYEIICFARVSDCLLYAKDLKEGNLNIQDTTNPLWYAQYEEGDNDSDYVDVTIFPKIVLLGKDTGRCYVSVMYKYYDNNGRLVKKSGPENEILYLVKEDSKWQLQKVHRRA